MSQKLTAAMHGRIDVRLETECITDVMRRIWPQEQTYNGGEGSSTAGTKKWTSDNNVAWPEQDLDLANSEERILAGIERTSHENGSRVRICPFSGSRLSRDRIEQLHKQTNDPRVRNRSVHREAVEHINVGFWDSRS